MPSIIQATLSAAVLFSVLPAALADASDRKFNWGDLPDTWQDGQSGESKYLDVFESNQG